MLVCALCSQDADFKQIVVMVEVEPATFQQALVPSGGCCLWGRDAGQQVMPWITDDDEFEQMLETSESTRGKVKQAAEVLSGKADTANFPDETVFRTQRKNVKVDVLSEGYTNDSFAVVNRGIKASASNLGLPSEPWNCEVYGPLLVAS